MLCLCRSILCLAHVTELDAWRILLHNTDMNIAKLIAAMKVAGMDEVRGAGYDFLTEARRFLAEADKVEARWFDYRRDLPNVYSPPDMWKEITYDKCITWNVRPVLSGKDAFEFVLTMWDGDMMYGQPTEKRASWTFLVTDKQQAFVGGILKICILRELNNKSFLDLEYQKAAEDKARAKKIFDAYFDPHPVHPFGA